ncbi:MAG: hypothetical protein IKF19_02025 [Bacilli bacterium]|nr:hypothetical protein [Bacilli bacterium]
MRKILLVIIIVLIITTGCALSNNPNSRVEELLGKYQGLDNSIIISPSILANDNNLNINLDKKYSDIIKKQYQNMVYEIKDTKEDGDNAVVTAEIEVMNYKKIINNMSGDVSEEYHNRLINKLRDVRDKVTYTIDFKLTKDNDGNWKVESLTNDMENKLLGIY